MRVVPGALDRRRAVVGGVTATVRRRARENVAGDAVEE
jgi:hypothetical protein